MKTIGITGGAGFVGKHVTKLLKDKGYQVVIFTRTPEKFKKKEHIRYAYWDPAKNKCDLNYLKQLNGVIHLAGAGIADKRWTDKRKQEIVESRVQGTNFLVQQLKEYAPDCTTLVSASASGYYGADKANGKPFTESDPPASDFLGDTCVRWEDAAHAAEDAMRLVIYRFGIVLGKEAGAFKEFEQPMNFGIKPILGSGHQKVSWIHVDDLAHMLVEGIKQEKLQGIYNAVAPQPVTHKALMQTIADVKGGIKIPAPVPAFALRIMLGEMSEEVLKSCTVSSQKIQDAGFTFQHPTIGNAVADILKH